MVEHDAVALASGRDEVVEHAQAHKRPLVKVSTEHSLALPLRCFRHYRALSHSLLNDSPTGGSTVVDGCRSTQKQDNYR